MEPQLITISQNGQLNFWECDTELSGLIPVKEEVPVKEEEEEEENEKEEQEKAVQGDLKGKAELYVLKFVWYLHCHIFTAAAESKTEGKVLYKRLAKWVTEYCNCSKSSLTVWLVFHEIDCLLSIVTTSNQLFFLRHNFKESRGANAGFAQVSCADYHKKSHILVTGFSDGAFFLHEMPDFVLIHSLRSDIFTRNCSLQLL